MERIALILLLGVALLTALVPLVVLHDPNGARASNVFDLPAGINQLQAELRIVAPIKSAAYSGPAVSAGATPPATPGPMPIPFSIQMAPILPWCISAALAFSLLALLDILFFDKAVALFSLIGGFLAAVALLHLLVLGSDLQAWTEALKSITELSAPADSALGARILTINSFLVTPGVGLFVLTRNQREGTPANPEEHGYVVRVEKKDQGGCRFAIRRMTPVSHPVPLSLRAHHRAVVPHISPH